MSGQEPLQQETLGGHPFARRRLLGTGRNPVYDGVLTYPDGRQEAYAVKLTTDVADETFGSETELLKGVRIKGSVPTYGPFDYVGPHGEQGLGVVSPRIRGQNLDAYVRGSGPLPREEAIAALAQGARTLNSAHSQGIVHMDVKPSNFMREASTGRILLIDWELAQPAGTGVWQGKGTAQYMAPEVARMRPPGADGRMDVYSLGNTIAEAHTGVATRQFPKGSSRVQVGDEARFIESENRFIASDRSQPRIADPHLNLIFQRATMPEARQRGTALDVMTDLAAYRAARGHFDEQDRAAITDNLVRRASAFDRRHPILDAAAAHGLLADTPKDHPQYRHLVAISHLGPALAEHSAAPSQAPAPTAADQVTPQATPSATRGMGRA